MFKCPDCEREFESVYRLNSHKRVHKPNYNKRAGYEKGAGIAANEAYQARLKEYEKNPRLCKECSIPLPYTRTSSKKQFCSSSCAASYNNAHRETKTTKIRNRDKPLRKKRTIVEKILLNCATCEKQVYINPSLKHRKCCSKECSQVYRKHNLEHKEKLSKAGRKSAENQQTQKRSKNEILFSTLCLNNWPDTISNVAMFNGWDADVIIPSLRVAVLWNGPWHYTKITKKHSVEQVQNRDNIKQNEIKKYGFVPYVIQDLGKFNSKFVYEQFENFKLFIDGHVVAGERFELSRQ